MNLLDRPARRDVEWMSNDRRKYQFFCLRKPSNTSGISCICAGKQNVSQGVSPYPCDVSLQFETQSKLHITHPPSNSEENIGKLIGNNSYTIEKDSTQTCERSCVFKIGEKHNLMVGVGSGWRDVLCSVFACVSSFCLHGILRRYSKNTLVLKNYSLL